MKRLACIALAFAAVAIAQDKKPASPGAQPAAASKEVTADNATSPLDFTLKDIDGKDVPLSKYKGKVVLLVNVASKCGLTPQYEQLQKLHEKYANKGLAILAIPANNFGGQEPGTNAEIKEFCKTKFSVSFDLFAKVSVKGADACELYKYLTGTQKNEKFHGDIEWNFAKFLVDRNGDVIQRFKPPVKPDNSDFVKAIEAALDQKPAKKGE